MSHQNLSTIAAALFTVAGRGGLPAHPVREQKAGFPYSGTLFGHEKEPTGPAKAVIQASLQRPGVLWSSGGRTSSAVGGMQVGAAGWGQGVSSPVAPQSQALKWRSPCVCVPLPRGEAARAPRGGPREEPSAPGRSQVSRGGAKCPGEERGTVGRSEAPHGGTKCPRRSRKPRGGAGRLSLALPSGPSSWGHSCDPT